MCKKILFLLLVVSFVLFNAPSQAVTKSQLNSAINRILQSTGEDLNVGIIIANPSNGKILYAHNPDRLFTPASNMKLFTAYAALNSLPAQSPFQTAIYVDSSHLINGELQGNVYLQFSGDPSFTSQKLN